MSVKGFDSVIVGDDRFKLLFSEQQIQIRTEELAKQISDEYKHTIPVFIGVLNGSFLFMSDLIRYVTIDCEIDFFKLSSYGDDDSGTHCGESSYFDASVSDRPIALNDINIETSDVAVHAFEDFFKKMKPSIIKRLMRKVNLIIQHQL